ncbi:hypothetical protein ACJIZ3_012925 [Penstemon smallii]|uniref:NAC domain-containing protein n=1 Tax=Penstemon smallii TaxID=265156 RepID=A0ABD3USH9_9LAMI
MELENKKEHDHEDDVPLPGFRFHPTDEELVGFYLRRKVDKKPIRIELIKQTDIYKYDPWDLIPKSSSVVGEKEEWYFYCKRGRKYKNSIRPNRVTCSGFWKATGIDKPIYSSSSSGSGGINIIGLKKSLVYYRGSAGKGTKTDWMMHEFRLPSTSTSTSTSTHGVKSSTKNVVMDTKTINAQEAEVWTLCRIIKRRVSCYKKCVQLEAGDLMMREDQVASGKSTLINYKDQQHQSSSSSSTYNNSTTTTTSNKTCTSGSSNNSMNYSYSSDHHHHHINTQGQGYITFGHAADHQTINANNHQQFILAAGSLSQQASSISAGHDVDNNIINYEFLRHANWEDFQSILDNHVPFYDL